MSERRALLRKNAGSGFDPTIIANCVEWKDFSDDSYMTFTGSAVDTYTDKVNGSVVTKNSATQEMQWMGKYIKPLDTTPLYTSSYSAPITCNNYTFIIMLEVVSSIPSGTVYLNESWQSTRYLARNAGNLFRWRPTGGADTYSVSGIGGAGVVVISVTGGAGESQTIIRINNVSDNTRTESKGISLGSSTLSMGLTTAGVDLRPYQAIVYDRVLTSGEMTDIHDWLATKV